METRIGIEALKRAVNVLGSQAKAGEAVSVAQTTVSECIQNGKRVPAEWCAALDRATAAKGDRVSCHDLRPDIFPPDFVPPPTVAKRTAPRKRAAEPSMRRTGVAS